MGNKVVLTKKVSFDSLKDTDENIAAMGNIIQDSGATPNQKWSQEKFHDNGKPICVFSFFNEFFKFINVLIH